MTFREWFLMHSPHERFCLLAIPIILFAIIVSAVAVPITTEAVPIITRNLDREAQIIASIEQLNAAKAAFNDAVVVILKETGQPAIQNAKGLIEQGRAVLDAANAYAAESGYDPNDCQQALGLIAARCDLQSLEDKERILQCLMSMILICGEAITDEPIDPNLIGM